MNLDSAASRRHFLQSLGAAGAAAALAGCAPLAPSARVRLVDTHHHFFPPEYAKAWLEWQRANKVQVTITGDWTPAESLKVMDEGGVDTAVLSLASTPGTWFDQGPAEADRMAHLCNEFGARMVRDHPGRYGLFATLPMLDIDSTMRELAYAFDTLHADGIGLQTSYGERYPGDPLFRPVFEELNRRKAVVYFHPLGARCCQPPGLPQSSGIIENPTDTTRAVLSLLLGGTFARFRDIRWIFSHAGGAVPMLAGRMKAFLERKGMPSFAPNGIESELARLHYDTANATHAASMAALRTLVPASQITFGTDYPYFPVKEQVQSLRALGFPGAEQAAIEGGNIARLIPRLA